MLASAKTTIPTHSPTNRGTWRKTLCLLSLAALSLTINSCGGGNDSPQTAQQIVAQLVQQGYLKASNTDANDGFGYSLALAGDTLVVGAPGEASADGNQTDNSAVDSGAVYVFTRTGSNWSQQAYLKASNTEANDGFGVSVALAGDTLVVGAPGEASNATGINNSEVNNNAPNSGAVYVFTRTGTDWSQQAYVKASNTETNDGFGESVALAGDTLAVGATGESSDATGIDGGQGNNLAPESGAVYVFTRTGSDWTQQAYVKASNTGGVDWFGYSVALADDTLAVGAIFEASNATGINGNQGNNSAPESGAVYVFTRTNETWVQQAYVKASNAGAGDLFGSSIALVGDTLAVGAFGEASANGNPTNNSATDSGAAYVFTRTGSEWSQQAYVKASNPGSFDLFGSSIALSGGTLAVGAFGEASADGNPTDNNAPDSGAAYIFSLQ